MATKKYLCICKIGNKPDGTADCVKHRTSDLLKYTQFIDDKWPGWRWMNVYDKETGQQLDNFTRNKKPTKKTV